MAIAAGLPHSGSLAQASALHLYYLAAANQAAGRLFLRSPAAEYALTFKKGVVEHARGSLPEDELGRFLVQQEAILPEQAAQAETGQESFGNDLVSALIGLGFLNPAESVRVLQEHGTGLVARALLVEDGTFEWEPGAAPPPSSFPLGSRWGMLCDAARRIDALTARRRLGGRLSRAALRTGGRIEITELKLTPQESRGAALFDGGKSIAELAAANPAGSDLVHRLGFLLAECELLGFGAERPAPATPDASGHPPSPRPAAAPAPAHRATAPAPPRPAIPPRPAGSAPDPAALESFLRRIQGKDHFEVLGVSRNATPAQIKATYFQLAKIYHPDAAPAGEPLGVKQVRADIFAALSAAWGVLGDEQARPRYLEDLSTGGGTAVDVAAILRAEEVFQMATILVKTRKYEEARAKLDEALKLNADEPEFTIWKAWVDFLLAGEGRKAQREASAHVIEAALAKNSRCIPGYLFLGEMAKVAGDAAAAERHFKRGLAVDPANVELTRELKYLKK